MKLALEKYGINLPSFGKIGGILANEVHVAYMFTYLRSTCTRTYSSLYVIVYRMYMPACLMLVRVHGLDNCDTQQGKANTTQHIS